MKVMIVENEPLIAEALCYALQAAGHVVLDPLSTARAALELMALTVPDLAILDGILDDGKTGASLGVDLHTRWNVPVLFACGSAVSPAAQAVALGRISKPYSPSTVVLSVAFAAALLEGRDPGRPPKGLRLFQRGARLLADRASDYRA